MLCFSQGSIERIIALGSYWEMEDVQFIIIERYGDRHEMHGSVLPAGDDGIT